MALTILRLLLLPVFLWLLLLGAGQDPHPYRWHAIGLFAFMALTDNLDGYLARRFKQRSRLGAILDPMADKLLIVCSVILLSLDWIVPPQYRIPLMVVAFIIGKDLVVVLGTVVLIGLIGPVRIAARLLGKVSTGLQLALVLATLLAPDLQQLTPALPQWLLPGLWWAVSAVALAACADYVRIGVLQLKAKPRESLHR